MRKFVFSLVAGAFLVGRAIAAEDPPSSLPVQIDAQPNAAVTLQGGSFAAGFGYTWGRGDLTYGGDSHRFKISGLSIVEVGATNFTASGSVYNLKTLSDFAGNYVAVSAGVTIAGGGTAVYLKNEHGVVIRLRATEVGLKFNLAADGVHVAFKS